MVHGGDQERESRCSSEPLAAAAEMASHSFPPSNQDASDADQPFGPRGPVRPSFVSSPFARPAAPMPGDYPSHVPHAYDYSPFQHHSDSLNRPAAFAPKGADRPSMPYMENDGPPLSSSVDQPLYTRPSDARPSDASFTAPPPLPPPTHFPSFPVPGPYLYPPPSLQPGPPFPSPYPSPYQSLPWSSPAAPPSSLLTSPYYQPHNYGGHWPTPAYPSYYGLEAGMGLTSSHAFPGECSIGSALLLFVL